MKKTWTAAALAAICLLSGCGGEAQNTLGDAKHMKNDEAREASYGDYENYEAYDEAKSEENSESPNAAEAAEYTQAEVRAINTQMLVYSCNMSIDVLEFDEAVDKFHDLIKKYEGFIENETYSDGGDSSKWQYTEDQKWKTLRTVIRIPSASYDNFCKDAENVGDMRRKDASVQNLTTEYSDLKTTLSIYEAKEKRYIALLSEMTSESDALAVENELTDIQIQIAKIKTRMNNIENDVAYSYINLTLNEVREYSAEPVIEKTDTFGQRLSNTVSKTWHGFLEFLEALLFLVIRMLPYLLIIGIVVFFVVKAAKKKKAKKQKLAPRTADWPPTFPPAPPAKPETAAQETADTAENASAEEPQTENKTENK